ncbi:MAG: TIGR01459 family HAD-type hydrolase [Pseudomonadota bacterium]
MTSEIPILQTARPLLAEKSVVFCDVWGVVHNGQTAYRDACALLSAYRRNGGCVILVSNAPRRSETVASVLDDKQVPRACWDAIMSSGAVTVRHVLESGFQAVHHIGPERDVDLFDAIDAPRVALDDADAIVATGLIHDHEESGEDYRERLKPALARGLPLICANPDLVVDVGGTLLPCAGAIAAVYEDMGGSVFWAGKPHREAYAASHALAETILGRPVQCDEILAIGDAERTDIAGAHRYGIEAVFIGQGIHREDVMPDGLALDRAALEALFDGHAHRPLAALSTLA